MSRFRFFSRLASAAAMMTLLAAMPAMAAAQDSVAAVWVPRQVQFIYQGFTTHYSCDGLRDTIRGMLERLGAHDLDVQQFGCVRVSGPSPFPGVRVRMRVLVPASSAEASRDHDAGAPVQAHWKEVTLMPANADISEQGNCELIEQFKETFLPLFTTRHVNYSSSCVPHQITLGTHLTAQVLMAPGKADRR